MSDARTRLEAMVAGLRDNPRVEVVSAAVGDPTSAADLASVERLAPAGVLDFYRQVGSFSLEWRHTVAELSQGDLADQGFVNIIPITEVYGDWAGNVWFPGDDETFRDVKPFDAFVPEACAAFTDGDTVVYHYYGEEVEDTGRTFAEWFELLLVSRGYWYWIQTLCAETAGSHEAEAFRRVMPQVFPGIDIAEFRPLA
ncbi:hypothetical protein AB0I28_36710 [Phytomonospora sp. NPDC050363]|uniref:hypothetical protein n=1 Tax=Phytomonospora sp. NPDC050363 TaxID=3155642 RepID=UPI0033EEC6C3